MAKPTPTLGNFFAFHVQSYGGSGHAIIEAYTAQGGAENFSDIELLMNITADELDADTATYTLSMAAKRWERERERAA